MYYFISNIFYLLPLYNSFRYIHSYRTGSIYIYPPPQLYVPHINKLLIRGGGGGRGGGENNTTVSDVTDRLGGGGRGRDGNANRLATTYTDGYEPKGGGGGGRRIIDIRLYINWW
jgi:hypothetical protein